MGFRPSLLRTLPAAVAAALVLAASPAFGDDAPAAAAAAAPKDTVRPEIGKPLQEAQALLKDKKYREALAKLKEAEAIPQRTPYENFIIDQLRAGAASGAGDDETAVASAESLVASGRLSPQNQLSMMKTIGYTYYKLKYYSKAASWYTRVLKETGDATMEDLIIQCFYQGNDFAGVVNEAKAANEADEKAGRNPSEARLQMLINAQLKLNDNAGQIQTLERLLNSYPNRNYWEMAISKVAHKPGFADRLTLDLLRLRNALGDLRRDTEYMEMAQLALEVGFPTEAKKILDQGFAAGVLGKGPDAEREKRLQAKANHDAAEDAKALGIGDMDAEKAKGGDAMVNGGFNYVMNGKADKGLPLMEAGLRKGGLKHADDARLHFGLALAMAGQKARAVEELRNVRGNDGAADLAHLWAIHYSK